MEWRDGITRMNKLMDCNNLIVGKQQTRILIIGSERSNFNGRLSGSIYFYKI